jgi:hypothetical protein
MRIIYSHSHQLPESHLTLNGWNIPFVNSVKYFFDNKVTWRLHIAYSLLKSEHLSANIKLTLHKALIKRIMTYACPAWEFAADNHLLKLQCLQNNVLHTTGNFWRRTLVCDLHMAFKLPHLYDYITKLCKKQAEVIQNNENASVRNTGQGKAQHRKYNGLKIGTGSSIGPLNRLDCYYSVSCWR